MPCADRFRIEEGRRYDNNSEINIKEDDGGGPPEMVLIYLSWEM